MPLPLSILDLSLVDSGGTAGEALQNTIAIARAADRLGYRRLWLAEHHNLASIASPAPEIMIGQIAMARLALPPGARLLPGSAREEQEFGHLAGRVGQYGSLRMTAHYPNLARAHVEWLVAAPTGASLALTIVGERAGTRRATVIVGG